MDGTGFGHGGCRMGSVGLPAEVIRGSIDGLMAFGIKKLAPIVVILAVALWSVWPAVVNPSGVADFGSDGWFINWVMNRQRKNVSDYIRNPRLDFEDIFQGNIFYPNKNVLAYSELFTLSGLTAYITGFLSEEPGVVSGAILVLGQVATMLVIYLMWSDLTKNEWAAAMGTVAFMAQATGRLTSAWKGLLLSGLAMLVIWPAWISDLGFILSFVATASILIFEPKVKKLLSRFPKILREDFSVTLAAQIGVTPIIFATFGQFNLLSPIINVLVLWTVAPITVIAGVSAIVGLVFPFMGKLLLYLCYPLAFWFVKVIEVFS